MRIYRMTATFGKLDHETLTLEPGLNVIEAPNEWGKSTWCAFLITMLYGLDTSKRTRKTALADKEKYAPWSGSPMSGRIDLNWKGRDVTIERSTKGRTPLGIFRAYETESGLAVPELTASNCGQALLGAEQSVYRQSGFIRQAEMPVNQDDALRRRLNALVTTGDESGDSDRLEARLKELKNKCRYNRSGLLPQAEAKCRELNQKVQDLKALQSQTHTLKERLGETKSWIRTLENHADALRYAAAEADEHQVALARDQRDRAEAEMLRLQQICAGQPSSQETQTQLQAIQAFRQELEDYRLEEISAAGQPQAPVPPEQFRGLTESQAEDMVGGDIRNYELLKRTKPWLLFWLFSAACLILGILALLGPDRQILLGGGLSAGALLLLIPGLRKKAVWVQKAETLEEKYGSAEPADWQRLLEEYRRQATEYDRALAEYRGARQDLDIRKARIQNRRKLLFGDRRLETELGFWQTAASRWADYDAACERFRQAENNWQTLRGMSQAAVKKPAMEDSLTYSEQETRSLLADALAEQQHLLGRLGQCRGRMEAMGDAGTLLLQLRKEEARVAQLEAVYEASTLALETLDRARQELQRRFAPRISSRARELMEAMTGGRYDRLTLNQDLSLLAGAKQEDVLREVLWRSDGTVDQLYLALRLAVAEELLPKAPLVLDDALVRFDDNRLKAAMEILKEEAEQKQVILFTCQHRETELRNKMII